jgi:hypothetical protein
MLNNEGAISLLSVVYLAGLCYLVFWRFRALCVDAFRQKMFVLRDSFFDEAADGLIGFDHPAYKMLRNTMNGFIRFAHHLSLWDVLFMFLFVRNASKEASLFRAQWKKTTADLDDSTKKTLNTYRERMHRLAIYHVVLSTPELWLPYLAVLFILALCILLRICCSQSPPRSADRDIQLSLLRRFQSIDDAALICGRQ